MVNERGPGAEDSAVNGPVADYQPISRAVPAAAADGGSGVSVEAVNGGESFVAKRKRGRPPKNGAAGSCAKKSKKEEEDVCFICFDGGKLVLYDRRVCPKAYHPACVKHDESFFKRRARWNCGWHYCNICLKNAVFMCYMCPYSLCETCVKQADISCVRGKKGFCKTCMTYVSLIEDITQGNEEVGHLDFDDTARWEYLFKAYWVSLKQKESLNLDELTRAKNPWKGLVLNHVNNPSQESHNTVNRNVGLSSTLGLSGKSNTQVETNDSKRRKTRSRKQPQSQKDIVADKLQEDAVDWASNELLEFVAHVKNGDTSKLNKFDVQALLLEYIRKNKLRDSHRKCQVICDKRLEILFGKVRVGHFEMLKLLEYHFKEGSCASDVVHAATIDSSPDEMKTEKRRGEEHNEGGKQACKAVDDRERPIMDNYAAIDVHNMRLIYLRRSLVENLMEDTNSFQDGVVGSIVRIRISGGDLQETYRLVCIVGTSKAAQPYKTGDRTADIMLKILNLDRIEDARIDAISDQDFSEGECRRLRQSIKSGLLERMTVGEVHKKAIALQEVRIKDALQMEILKLNQIRDRASEMGRRKEVRECLEKLELLKSPEEFQRRMCEIPEVHSDPRMDPNYQSDEDIEQPDTKKQDLNMPPKLSDSSWAELSTPQSVDMSDSARENAQKEDDTAVARSHENSQSTLETDAARILEELRNQVDPNRIISKKGSMTPNHGRDASDASVSSSSSSALSPDNNTELEKAWHYKDPLGNVQGPFCMLQLRNWDSSGYFPVDLRVWRIDESQDKSVLLRDVLLKQCGTGHQFRPDCLESHRTEFASEHGRQLGININAVWASDEPNDACDSDTRDPVWCPDDKKQTISGQNMDSSVQEVSAACPAIEATVECSRVPGSSPENDHDDSRCFAVEPGPSSNKSGSSPKMSSGGPAFLDLLSSSGKPELHQENLKSRVEENKVGFDLESEPKDHKQPVTSVLDHCQTPEQHSEEAKSRVAEVKQSVASYLTGQQQCSSWNAITSGAGFSVPVSSGDQSHQEIKGLSAENTGVGWTSAASLAGGTVQPVGYSMQPESRVAELDSGVASGMSMKFSDLVTSASEGCQFTHSSSAHPDCSMSSWPDGPIELSTLGDDSVSELLSQVEALESLNGLPSSNAQVDFGDDTIESPSNDCFSRLVGFSPQLESGKHDAWGSTCDIQFNSQPMVTEPHPPYPVNLHGCPSNPSDGQLRPEFASIQQDFLSLTCTYPPSHVPAVDAPPPRPLPPMSPPLPPHQLPPRPSLPASPPPPQPSRPVSPPPPLQPPPLPLQPPLPPPPRPSLPASPLPPLQPPSSKVDAPSSPVEEGEVDPTSLSSELSVKVPVADSPKRSFPQSRFSPREKGDARFSPREKGDVRFSPREKGDARFGPREKGDAKPAAYNTPRQKLSSPDPRPLLPSPKPISDRHLRTGAGRAAGRGSAGSSASGSMAGNAKSSSGTRQETHRSSMHPTANRGNRSSQQQSHHGGGAGHSGQDRRSYHPNADLGFGKGGSRSAWQRQSSFSGGSGGGGGGAPRQPPSSSHRGQRVCKFYESGYCRKGASCNYLHP